MNQKQEAILIETINKLKKIAEHPSCSERIRKKIQRDIKVLQDELAGKSKLVRCSCGEMYNPKFTALHGDNHILIGREPFSFNIRKGRRK